MFATSRCLGLFLTKQTAVSPPMGVYPGSDWMEVRVRINMQNVGGGTAGRHAQTYQRSSAG